MIRINLWSSPRNISTALMYSFAQREDTTVVDEPLYAHYLSHVNVTHPAQEAILNSQYQDGEKVVQEVLLGEYSTPIVLHKQMTHHLIELGEDFLYKMKNVLLIRNPHEIIASYSKVRPIVTMQDVGIKKQQELYLQLKEKNSLAAIIDTNELLKNPEQILRQLCICLDIPFDKNMLQWKAGARKEDGIWAKYWYKNVHQSTGFKPYIPRTTNLEGDLKKLAEQCQAYYDFLFEKCIKST